MIWLVGVLSFLVTFLVIYASHLHGRMAYLALELSARNRSLERANERAARLLDEVCDLRTRNAALARNRQIVLPVCHKGRWLTFAEN